MSSLTKGAWRSIRCLLLIACAGGVLAADNTWVSTLNLGFSHLGSWFASVEDPSDLPAVFDFSVSDRPRTETSMGSFLNAVLFSRTGGISIQAASLRASTGASASRYEAAAIDQTSQNDFIELRSESAQWARGPVSGGSEGPAVITAASGTWTSNASGNWGNSANWSGNVIADGAGNTANFDAINITTNVTVTLDTSRTIGSLSIGDTNGTHHYTISPSGGSALTFDASTGELTQRSFSAGDTIAVPIFFNGNYLDVYNDSTSNPLTISGNIASSGGTGFPLLTFGGNSITVSGNISDGTTGRELSVDVNGRVVTFTGTNTYTGSTDVSGGVLLINGDNSAATGSVYVSLSGSVLGGTGTVGGSVQTFDGTITGGTATTAGALTLLGNVDLSTGEGTGTYLANLVGSTSDLLDITGFLSLGQGSILDIEGVGDGVTTYTLATFDSRDGLFGSVMDIPDGYSLVYHDMDIQLVPTAVPEPATWIGGGLALGTLVFAGRKRKR